MFDIIALKGTCKTYADGTNRMRPTGVTIIDDYDRSCHVGWEDIGRITDMDGD